MAPLKLPLYGPARLEGGGETLRLNRPALAVLYYLALEGPTRRERLADLLWGDGAAATNLRGALHGLRGRLRGAGLVAFPKGQDPLRLPSFITLDELPGRGEVMEGLEGLSPEFGAWLGAQRNRREPAAPAPRQELVRGLAERVRAPFLILLEGAPDAGGAAFARALAEALRLPFIDGAYGEGAALRYARAEGVTGAIAAQIRQNRRSVWVLERSTFGEEPRAFLELRGSVPHERTLYLKLPPLSWAEARGTLLGAHPFAAAAALYLAAGGQPDALAELVRHARQNGLDALERTPRRISALYQLEARYLSVEARFALERLSVHPGFLTDALISGLGEERHLEELERRGWLVFEGAWRFVSDTARHSLYGTLHEGRARRLHLQLAELFSAAGDRAAADFHRWRAGEAPARPRGPGRAGSATPGAPAVTRFGLAGELPLQGTEPGLEDDTRIVWVRTPLLAKATRRTWLLPDEPCVVRLSGELWTRNAFDRPLTADAWPLRLEFGEGGASCDIVPDPSASPADGTDYAVHLGAADPLGAGGGAVDLWFYAPGGRSVTLSSRAERGVFDLEVRAYRCRGHSGGSPGGGTEAYALVPGVRFAETG